MNSTSKEKLMVNIEACEEGEHTDTHESTTVAMKYRQS
jgi:hypothetical protein